MATIKLNKDGSFNVEGIMIRENPAPSYSGKTIVLAAENLAFALEDGSQATFRGSATIKNSAYKG